MGLALLLPSAAALRLRFSPLGESLSFAWPKESNQRKGDPTSLPCGFPIWRGRAGQERNRVRAPQQGTFCVPCQGELVERPPAHAKSAALKGNTPRYRRHVMPSHHQALAHALEPLVCRREAQPDGGERCGVSEPARASSRTAPAGEHRRGAEGRHARGGFFFGYFLLATQKKVTRPQAKSEALARPA